MEVLNVATELNGFNTIHGNKVSRCKPSLEIPLIFQSVGDEPIEQVIVPTLFETYLISKK